MLEEMQTGRIIKQLRNDKGYSQKQLAEILNVAQNTVSNWENGTRETDNKTLVELAKIFNVSTDYILGKTNTRNYEPETIAAHHDGDEFTEEELKSIEEFKEFVRMRREQKEKNKP